MGNVLKVNIVVKVILGILYLITNCLDPCNGQVGAARPIIYITTNLVNTDYFIFIYIFTVTFTRR